MYSNFYYINGFELTLQSCSDYNGIQKTKTKKKKNRKKTIIIICTGGHLATKLLSQQKRKQKNAPVITFTIFPTTTTTATLETNLNYWTKSFSFLIWGQGLGRDVAVIEGPPGPYPTSSRSVRWGTFWAGTTAWGTTPVMGEATASVMPTVITGEEAR